MRVYTFEDIPRLSLAQANLLASFSRYLDAQTFGPSFGQAFTDLVTRCCKLDARLAFDTLDPASPEQVKQAIPEHAVLVLVSMPPSGEQLLVELDAPICMAVIDRLLGGGGKPLRIHRALTEVEQGVLSYMLLQVLALVQGQWRGGGEQALRLDRFLTGEARDAWLASQPGFFRLAYRLYWQKVIGYARVYIPDTIAQAVFASPAPQGGAVDAVELDLMRRNLARLGEQRLELRARCASLHLGPEELKALEVGDIILLEETDLSLAGGQLSGSATLRFGLGHNTIQTRLVERGGYYDLEVVDLVTQEFPMSSPGQAPAAPGEGDNLPQTEGLLRDVPAPIVVELGRIQMNTAQVIRLKPGQVLKLGRGPSEPVDLVVNNRVFARGTLLEVEGELGVRIAELA